MGNNIDIDLFTQKSEITTSTPDITIEITGLAQLNSLIGLDDTPTYYENGKFFKVEDNKIVYTDINWGDIKGKIKDNPGLVKEIGEFIQKETEQYTSEAVTKAIKTHDADANAHQSIQLTIQDNYTTLDNKIELNKIDSNTKFDEVNKKVSDNTEYITRVDNYSQEVNKKLEDLTLEVDVDIKGDIKQLRNDLTTTNQTVQDNYTALDTKIDNVSKDVQNNYTALDTRISANTKDISDLTQTVQNDYKELNDHITDVNSKVTTNTTNINKNTELINQTVENLKKYSKTEDFATVAFTGRYADLIDIPNNIATTEYVDGKIGEVVQFSFLIVDELPKIGETNHIYLVLNKTGKTGNVYLEYLWIESTQSYELIGSTEVDLSGYYTKEQTDNLLVQKVDKVDGKSLILDTEIERLGTLKNYDDTGIKQSVSDLSTKVNTKQDKLTFDTAPTADSTNPVTSGGIKNALEDITIKVDNTTISKSTKNVISTIGIKTKNDINAYDWIGTQSEYTTDLASGVITETTRCYITDDEQELIGDIGVSIPTKVSDLSNDSGFVNQQELDAKQDKLTAGNGISIQNNIISSTGSSVKWGNITGSISGQKDLYDSLARKVTKVEGKSLISNTEIDRLKNVHNYDDTELRSTRATTDLSNLTTTGEKHFLNKSQITNCLLEVPQRIKYTLENGTLTIKAGSVVIVPYGTEDKTADLPKGATFLNDNFKVYDTQYADGKFFVWVELRVNLPYLQTWDTAESMGVYISKDASALGAGFSRYSSGTVAPTQTNIQIWYDTTNNLVKIYSGGILSSSGHTFPIMLISVPGDNTTGVSSVQQVFNGMGYIGSTVWVDKGVKGLIPDGRNEDGSLKNIELETTSLKMLTETGTGNYTLRIANNEIGDSSIIAYNEGDNYNIWTNNNTINYCILAGTLSRTSGKISNWRPKLPFRALDYSDKTKITNWSFPSDKYIYLTLNASGSTYTAPADGWFMVEARQTAINGWVGLLANLGTFEQPTNTHDFFIRSYLPVYAGAKMTLDYAGVSFVTFRFIYAKGSEPLA